MSLLNLDALKKASLTREPFEFLVAEDFLNPAALAAARRDFPPIADPGLFTLSELTYGPGFQALIEAIQSPELAQAFSEKFGVDLIDRPLMITVRGRCQPKDGRIHTDSKDKLVTALLYLNEDWDAEGGRLRLLRTPDDIDDILAEIPPTGGKLVAFRRSDCSFHGHKPYVGVRRYIMFNWMSTTKIAARELARHRLSAHIKRWISWSGQWGQQS